MKLLFKFKIYVFFSITLWTFIIVEFFFLLTNNRDFFGAYKLPEVTNDSENLHDDIKWLQAKTGLLQSNDMDMDMDINNSSNLPIKDLRQNNMLLEKTVF